MRIQTESKYRNKITELDGCKFASRKEAEYYVNLKLLKRAGQVTDFKLQPRFKLQDAYVNLRGEKVQKVEYVADFLVTYPDGRQEVVDVKGVRTPVYALKKKWFECKYPELQIVEIG